VLHSFCQTDCSDGMLPAGKMAIDAKGHLFGMTQRDSMGNDRGAVFKLVPHGANSMLTTLYTFCSLQSCDDGELPVGLVFGADEVLYGATQGGGTFGAGTVFRLRNTTESVLYSFCPEVRCPDGYPPGAVTLDSVGRILGTTSEGGAGNQGTLFRLKPQ
jgi:uncharacterized repeat protein (TIGR03803 family)